MARMRRDCDIFLYDPIACIFLVVLLFGFVWFVIGFTYQETGCFSNTATMVRIAQALEIAWPFGAIMLIVLSGCCQCCGPTTRQGHLVDNSGSGNQGNAHSNAGSNYSAKSSKGGHVEPAPQQMQASYSFQQTY